MRHLDTPTAMNCIYWFRHTQSWYETWENLSQNCPHPSLKTKLVVTTLNNELWFPILTWSYHSLPSMTHIKQPKTTSAAMNSVHWIRTHYCIWLWILISTLSHHFSYSQWDTKPKHSINLAAMLWIMFTDPDTLNLGVNCEDLKQKLFSSHPHVTMSNLL